MATNFQYLREALIQVYKDNLENQVSPHCLRTQGFTGKVKIGNMILAIEQSLDLCKKGARL